MCQNKSCRRINPCNPITCNKRNSSININNTGHPNGYSDVTLIASDIEQLSAYKEHLIFVNSPEVNSHLKKHVVLKLSEQVLSSIDNLKGDYNQGSINTDVNEQDYL